MEYGVTIQINGVDVLAGTLFVNVKRGRETASFRYDRSYLDNDSAFPLSPDMPLVEGLVHAQGGRLFGAFEDCMPDRWGRNLMLRAERRTAREEGRTARTLFEHDFLAGVDDTARQGALRIWMDGKPVASAGRGVPREASIPDLLKAADVAANSQDADVSDLVAAGSSLGGARPKASVVDEHGALYIAKFPAAGESPEEDVCAWEKTALDLAAQAGIRVPNTRLMRVAGRAVLLVERFDRQGEVRIPYMSGMAALQGADGHRYSYLELVEFLEISGSAPDADIRELWRRVLFSCAIGNVDDHMRNHGFLRERDGWRLSPAFDVNPSAGDNPKYLQSTIDLDNDEAHPQAAIDACEWFRIDHAEALEEARKMSAILSRWHRVASSNGISKDSVSYMVSCMEAGIVRLANVR